MEFYRSNPFKSKNQPDNKILILQRVSIKNAITIYNLKITIYFKEFIFYHLLYTLSKYFSLSIPRKS